MCASLSPNGQYIVYDVPVSKQDHINHDIFLLTADGSTELPLIQETSRDTSPLWTPDGKPIVFESDQSGVFALWKLEIHDGKAKGSPVILRTIDENMSP